MRVGFIGLGNMGSGMAASLLGAGHEVTVYNRTRSRAEPLGSDGAQIANSIDEACRGEAVFTMLSDDKAVEDVAFGPGGVVESLAPGAVHVSSSTISVALSRKLAETHAQKGQRYVSAPVLGRPDRAAEGQLFVIAAGPSDAIGNVTPLLDGIGQRTIRFGEEASNANLVKLSANFLIASVIESLGEAIALVDRAGLDREAYVDFLTSTLFAAPIYKTYGGLIAADEEPAVGFAAPLGLKDVRLALAAARERDLQMPLGALLEERFVNLIANGGENADWSAVGRTARARVARSKQEAAPAE
jgi:3-hydroxyisobutyrate dehydrogenase-like beta-hydroxyacid dehydrogenase